jgi:hypothetical protein
LCRILQTALSGNSLISIICTISPTLRCAEESNNTLKFATRAKTIRMEAKVNESMDDKTLLRVYRLEIEELKARLRTMESMISPTTAEGPLEAPQTASGRDGSAHSATEEEEGDADVDVDVDNQLIMLQVGRWLSLALCLL